MWRQMSKSQILLAFSFSSFCLCSLLPAIARSESTEQPRVKLIEPMMRDRKKGQETSVNNGPPIDPLLDNSLFAIGTKGDGAEFLRQHNLVRLNLSLPLFYWDRNVAHYARRWAAQRATDCQVMHSQDGPYGENIFQGEGNQWRPADAVVMWADEQIYYDAKGNTCQPGQMCGHFTQVAWKSSVRLGCARAECLNGGGVFMICSYDPPGNWIGESPFS